eukprot:COSAG05_NODE_2021_length_3681_cov_40.184813_3_plen_174_part_00
MRGSHGRAESHLDTTINKLKHEMRSPATATGRFLFRCASSGGANNSSAICKYAVALSSELFSAPLNAGSLPAVVEWFAVYVDAVKRPLTTESQPTAVYAVLGLARLLTVGGIVRAEATEKLQSVLPRLEELVTQLSASPGLAAAVNHVAQYCGQGDQAAAPAGPDAGASDQSK